MSAASAFAFAEEEAMIVNDGMRLSLLGKWEELR
jgi:hypothetical protein